MLKLVLCDGVPASGILAMTFTRKAAEEMRSRVLGDGFAIIDAAREDRANSPEMRTALGAIDLGQVQVGTIDSFCARWAREGSDPDDPFDIDDVARGLTEKMVRRHPHVFAEQVVGSDAELERQVQPQRDGDHRRDG